jgi:hypothetical protein
VRCGRGAREPRVGFGRPAAAVAVDAQSLPDDAADVGVVDRAAEGVLEDGRANGARVVGWCQPDGLGDEQLSQTEWRSFFFETPVARTSVRQPGRWNGRTAQDDRNTYWCIDRPKGP